MLSQSKRTVTVNLVTYISLICYSVSGASDVLIDFPPNFIWGLATAAAQSEDGLVDPWYTFAQAGNIPAWKDAPFPNDRNRFWTQPEIELDLVAATGVNVFRMGVDWGRLVPQDPAVAFPTLTPGKGHGQIQNLTALARYGEIIDMARSRNMEVMMTLFHHSLPQWAITKGGWTVSVMSSFFNDFTKDIVTALGSKISYWNTFNEPTVYVLLTYCAGTWPPGIIIDTGAKLSCAFLPKTGTYAVSMANIVASHTTAFKIIKAAYPKSQVGVAHNVGWHVADQIWDEVSAELTQNILNYPFIDSIITALDFIGLNYYGKEISSGAGVAISPEFEYSESGRCVFPEGLYLLLTGFSSRYKELYPNVTLMVTENGISDRTDILRPSYIIEHLLAIKQAMKDGANVIGYLHWTVSDNWEWADGYCPKFGLVTVDRANNLTRIPLPSYSLFSSIVQSGVVTNTQRTDAWNLVQNAVKAKQTHYMCRNLDGESALDKPFQRAISANDWRFQGVTPDAYNGNYLYGYGAIIGAIGTAILICCYFCVVQIKRKFQKHKDIELTSSQSYHPHTTETTSAKNKDPSSPAAAPVVENTNGNIITASTGPLASKVDDATKV